MLMMMMFINLFVIDGNHSVNNDDTHADATYNGELEVVTHNVICITDFVDDVLDKFVIEIRCC